MMKKSNIGDKTPQDKGIPVPGNEDLKDAQVKAYEQGRPLPRNADAVVNEVVRPDPRLEGDDKNVPSSYAAPEHKANDIEGVIQEKKSPDAPITEKLPDERDLREGKITPAAVNKVPDQAERDVRADRKYAHGVTQADVDSGRISPAAVREIERSATDIPRGDEDLYDMVTIARNQTAMNRLTHAELIGSFKTLEANGFKVSKA